MQDKNTETKETDFLRLVEQAAECRLCPRMEGRTRVLTTANGSLHARILFIAEAPGRFGGDKTGVPLTSDQTGRNFQLLLDKAGIARNTVFITNAILCNPRDAQGRNAPPSQTEVRNCSSHLKVTIDILQPQFVVTLGTVALNALNRIEAHDTRLSQDVGRCLDWYGRNLIPLYHPGPRAQLHRPFATQITDFQNLAQLLSEK